MDFSKIAGTLPINSEHRSYNVHRGVDAVTDRRRRVYGSVPRFACGGGEDTCAISSGPGASSAVAADRSDAPRPARSRASRHEPAHPSSASKRAASHGVATDRFVLCPVALTSGVRRIYSFTRRKGGTVNKIKTFFIKFYIY